MCTHERGIPLRVRVSHVTRGSLATMAILGPSNAPVQQAATGGYDSRMKRGRVAGTPKHLHYLALQGLEKGRAPHAHVHEILSGLMERGWRARLFAIHRIRGARAPTLRRLWEMAATVLAALRFLMLERPQVAYIRWHFASLPYAVACRALGVPVVQEVNGLISDVYLEWPAARLLRWPIEASMRWQLLRADEVITVTPELARWVGTLGRTKGTCVVPNGANTELFRPDRAQISPPGRRYVVFFGNLAPWQGIQTLLDARRSPDWPNDIGLVVLGDGRLREQVMTAADQGLVDYRGVVAYEDVPCFVAPALAGISVQEDTEGRASMGLSPVKVYETLASGVPIIVADMPPMADEVRAADVGIVVEPGNPRALARAVAELGRDGAKQREMARRARQLAVEKHSWKSRAEDTESVLLRACGQDAGHGPRRGATAGA